MTMELVEKAPPWWLGIRVKCERCYNIYEFTRGDEQPSLKYTDSFDWYQWRCAYCNEWRKFTRSEAIQERTTRLTSPTPLECDWKDTKHIQWSLLKANDLLERQYELSHPSADPDQFDPDLIDCLEKGSLPNLDRLVWSPYLDQLGRVVIWIIYKPISFTYKLIRYVLT
jgi:hypothetical protein